ncbi:MAG: hypothetical protein A2X77_04680 [Gammaproteobacteria bacterium GWE2_42_36]|nr:MAG: hypothetical protein A2X77_04680 [Gammaproteobacteria bacterium GWE2_42_36]
MNNLLILGAGGHGKVVADAAFKMGRWEEISFLDDRYPVMTSVLNHFTVIGKFSDAANFLGSYPDLIVALGNNTQRLELLRRHQNLGFRLATIIHPTASMSCFSRITEGSVVFAQAVVNPNVQIGFGSIINTAAVIEHDCVLSEGVHVAPNAVLCGAVNAGARTLIGPGAVVLENRCIEADVIIGAGAVVIHHILAKQIVVGVPARSIKNHE